MEELSRQQKLDTVCAAAYLRLNRLSKDKATIDVVCTNFDSAATKTVLAISKAFGGIMNKKVRTNLTRLQLKQLNKGIDNDCCYLRLPLTARKGAIDAYEIALAMNEVAFRIGFIDFSFEELYNEFFGGAQ